MEAKNKYFMILGEATIFTSAVYKARNFRQGHQN